MPGVRVLPAVAVQGFVETIPQYEGEIVSAGVIIQLSVVVIAANNPSLHSQQCKYISPYLLL